MYTGNYAYYEYNKGNNWYKNNVVSPEEDCRNKSVLTAPSFLTEKKSSGRAI
uniref:Uncharacterized protein n=1 Tax=Anguilla anguilla TaxID=7936 RepID=A0A0E9Q1X2_ANGAN